MSKSAQLFKEAQQLFPGGVNSPVRAFKSVGGNPIFFEYGEGAYLTDYDGKRYLDFVNSWGPAIVGHHHPDIQQAVTAQLDKGFGFGAPSATESELAKKVMQFIPSIEKIRFVSSGTEATMSAIRLARGATQRQKIVKFQGCYHGHVDALLVEAGSGTLDCGVPSSPGIPESVTQHTLNATYNDLESVKALFDAHGPDIAAVIVEPVAGNMNLVLPNDGFLQGLRDLCTRFDSVLIFDEVMTGFRVAKGGAQSAYNIRPDLTCLGKVIGGGMPVGAFGGRKDLMEQLAPSGPVYQAGTMSGNPVTMAAGLATLSILEKPGQYDFLSQQTERFCVGLEQIAQENGVALTTNRIGGMFGLFFSGDAPIRSFDQVACSDMERFKEFFHNMLQEGVYLAPSPWEAGFVSLAHTDEVINSALKAAEKALTSL